MALLESLELGLKLPESLLGSLCCRNETELRLTHYPAVELSTLRNGSRTRVSEHTDFGTLTMLFQDSIGGLEVKGPFTRRHNSAGCNSVLHTITDTSNYQYS